MGVARMSRRERRSAPHPTLDGMPPAPCCRTFGLLVLALLFTLLCCHKRMLPQLEKVRGAPPPPPPPPPPPRSHCLTSAPPLHPLHTLPCAFAPSPPRTQPEELRRRLQGDYHASDDSDDDGLDDMTVADPTQSEIEVVSVSGGV